MRSRPWCERALCSPTQARRLRHPAHDQGVQNAKRCAGSFQAAPAAAPAGNCSGSDRVRWWEPCTFPPHLSFLTAQPHNLLSLRVFCSTASSSSAQAAASPAGPDVLAEPSAQPSAFAACARYAGPPVLSQHPPLLRPLRQKSWFLSKPCRPWSMQARRGRRCAWRIR